MMKREFSNKFKYVFLQHGVMYMVSMDSKGRDFFRRGRMMPNNSLVVVSSEVEADHFIELGGYKKDELLITGLPKFDRNERNKDADRIVIMPTYRKWEESDLINDYRKTGYYKMLKELKSAIPENLKDKLIIMPHPLFRKALESQKTDLDKYIIKDFIYDDILKNTDILITDYSSVAYDAFYRGAKVLFWWKDKDECMLNYKGHLMLNPKNIFGDICYTKEDLSKAVLENYKKDQDEEYLKKYRRIVKFHDGKNTERLLEELVKHKIISK